MVGFQCQIHQFMWYRTYAFVKSSHKTARSPRFFFTSSMTLVIMLMYSRQPATPGTPPFWTDVSMYPLSIMKVVSLFARIPRKILPSMLRSEMVRNCLIPVEFSSLAMKHPSVTSQLSARKSFFHATLSSFQSLLLSLSQFLYTLYEMPFGPGADFALAFLRCSPPASSVPQL